MKLTGRTLAIIAALIAAGLTLVLWPKKALSPEDEIRALVARCVRGAEDKDLSVIMDALVMNFKGPNNASRDDVKGIIAYQVLRPGEATSVFNPSLDVTVTGASEGTISGKFVFVRGKVKTVDEGTALSAYQIDAVLQKRDGKWLFVSANYRQL